MCGRCIDFLKDACSEVDSGSVYWRCSNNTRPKLLCQSLACMRKHNARGEAVLLCCRGKDPNVEQLISATPRNACASRYVWVPVRGLR